MRDIQAQLYNDLVNDGGKPSHLTAPHNWKPHITLLTSKVAFNKTKVRPFDFEINEIQYVLKDKTTIGRLAGKMTYIQNPTLDTYLMDDKTTGHPDHIIEWMREYNAFIRKVWRTNERLLMYQAGDYFIKIDGRIYRAQRRYDMLNCGKWVWRDEANQEIIECYDSLSQVKDMIADYIEYIKTR
jgi:hypothetical protein